MGKLNSFLFHFVKWTAQLPAIVTENHFSICPFTLFWLSHSCFPMETKKVYLTLFFFLLECGQVSYYPFNKRFQAPSLVPVAVPRGSAEKHCRRGQQVRSQRPLSWNSEFNEMRLGWAVLMGATRRTAGAGTLKETQSSSEDFWRPVMISLRRCEKAEMTADECDFKGSQATWFCNVLTRGLKGKRLVLARWLS